MDAPRVVLDALSFPGLLRVLSVPPDFKTPVEEAESRRRDSKDQVQGTSGTLPRLGTALVFLGIKIFVTLQNLTFLRGSARHIIRIRRFRFQTDGETSFVRKAFYRGLKVPLVVHIVVPEAVRPPHPSREAHSLKQNLQASH
ncbi:hypothetical protein V6N12_028565 [Hibiscus sabdariffa]|uniref:Uncharacterized protein n=1 Tax=Hibiscus sabdariffa TaxID=183260 RepID=A0ABR2AYY9_9ROSI